MKRSLPSDGRWGLRSAKGAGLHSDFPSDYGKMNLIAINKLCDAVLLNTR
jgi:hypothetical protein